MKVAAETADDMTMQMLLRIMPLHCHFIQKKYKDLEFLEPFKEI